MEKLTISDDGLFADRYRLELLLGRGGMGEVYLASDTMLDDEKVALKVLRPEFATDKKHIQRFLREVQLTRKVTHPNIVRTFDVGLVDDNIYFTMEYVDSQPLGEMIKAGPTDPDEVARILIQVCEGLEAIHAEEIVHRDLKPGNVLKTEDGQVKITDFGVARPGSSNLTGQDEIIGSSHYMAPEVWVGRDISTPADMYALGVLGYELLTGCLPFDAENPAELMWKHLEEKPVQPVELAVGIPDWLNQLVLALLEKDQDRRPMSALEVKDYLRRHRTGQGVFEEVDVMEAVTDDGEGIDVYSPVEVDLEQSAEYGVLDTSQFNTVPEVIEEPVAEQQTERAVSEAIEAIPVDPCVDIVRGPAGKGASRAIAVSNKPETRKSFSKVILDLMGRGAVAAALPILLGAILIGPVTELLRYGWKVAPYASGSYMTFVFVCLHIVLYSAVFSLPVLVVLLVDRKVKDALEAITPIVVGITIVCLLSTAWRTADLVGSKASISLPVVAISSVSALKTTTVQGFQAAILSPTGSDFAKRNVRGRSIYLSKPQSYKVMSNSYLFMLAGFVSVFLVAVRRELWKRDISSGIKWCGLIAVLIVPLFSTELAFYAEVAQILGIDPAKSFEIQLGLSKFSTSAYGLALGAIHWAIIISFFTAYSSVRKWRHRDSEV